MSETKEEYWPNGQLKSRSNYNANDQWHGPYETWHGNGQQWVKSNCVNGQLHGSYETWHGNGQLCITCNYANDKLHGPYESWYESGQQWVKHNWYHGTKGQPTSHKFQVGHLVSYVHNNKENIDCIVQKIEQCGYVMSSGHFVVEQKIKGLVK